MVPILMLGSMSLVIMEAIAVACIAIDGGKKLVDMGE